MARPSMGMCPVPRLVSPPTSEHARSASVGSWVLTCEDLGGRRIAWRWWRTNQGRASPSWALTERCQVDEHEFEGQELRGIAVCKALLALWQVNFDMREATVATWCPVNAEGVLRAAFFKA